MHKPSSARDYLIAGLVGAVVVVFVGFYLYLRRGYLFDAPPSADAWFVPNKAIATGGALLLAFTFLIGPLTRYFNRFDTWLAYRKEIGIVGGLLAISHGFISFFALPKKFPQDRLMASMQEEPWGLLGAILLILLFIASFRRVIDWMGGVPWWFFQRWGLRLVVLFTVLHVGLMKWSGWKKWFLEGVPKTPELAHPWMTPASILAAIFVAWVVLVRLYETVFLFKDFGLRTKEITMDETLRKRGRQFFLGSFWVMVGLYVIVLTKWAGVASW